VYKLYFFVGFIGDEQVHAQKCYVRFTKSNYGLYMGWTTKVMRSLPIVKSTDLET
jgi:hypothetical protein